MKTPLFKFRGQRTYLHSTSVFDWIVSQLSDPQDIDFQFQKLTQNQCAIVEELGDPKDLVATFRSDTAILGVADTGTPIEQSYPCNEAAIIAEVNIDSDATSFEFPAIDSASYLETIVAIYKAMLCTTEDGQQGKLLFGRVKLKHVPKSGHCVVKHRRKFGGNFFEATLFCNDSRLGVLYFGQQ